tara:strand:+ start:313 stop:777 length:465 start_codon:yes stop_codon:yes gene_type:complete
MKNQNNIKKKNEKLEFYTLDGESLKKIYIHEPTISAGFPSPAEDYIDIDLNLHKYLVKHPAATYFVRASGYSMEEAGIYDGDLLVVDKSIEVKNKDIIIAYVNGEFTVKRYIKEKEKIILKPESKSKTYLNININETIDFEIWGVVTFTIHKNK